MTRERDARAVSSRLREVAAVADLRPARRLAGKVPMGADAVSGRLRRASALTAACRRLAALGPARPQSSSADPTW